MTVRKHVNNYGSSLNGSINNSVTTIVVTSATGLPTITGSDFYNLTLDDGNGNIEIVQVTARSGTSLTVVRAAESTTAQAWASGVAVQLRPTADSLDRKLDIANALGFGQVAVSGQTTCASTVLDDTLTLVAGSNITLTTSGNAVTVASSGGGITALTGDVTASGTGSVAATLATVTVPKGGTGLTTQNAYGVLCGGTTSTGAMQSIAPGTSTYVLTSNGAGALPTWQAASGGSSVTVTGTGGFITAVLTGSNYQIDIAGTYAGQTSITTLGTIGTGTWAATAVEMAYGGTGGSNSPSNGGIVYTNATQMAVMAGTATANKMLLSGASTSPFWSAATIPQNAGSTAGKYLYCDGSQNYVLSTSTWPDTGTVNTLIVGAGSSYVELATVNSKILTTNGSGVPAWSSTAPSGYTLVAPVLGTPASGTLTNCTALPITAVYGSVLPAGRLTLATVTPVMTSNTSAQTTIYYTPYLGNIIPIYDGTNMVIFAFSELSVATTDTAKSPAAIGASKVNDWFVWNDSGTLRVGHGPDWTNDTTRSAGTALVMTNGIYLNNASITNGPAASRGTYVGTTRSNGSSQLDWILGGSANDGSPASLFVWNMYNRVMVHGNITDARATHAYTTAAWQGYNNATGMRVTAVLGLAETAMCANALFIAASTSASITLSVGIGKDSTTAISGSAGASIFNGAGAVNSIVPCSGFYKGYPGLGVHYLQGLEYGGTNATQYGTAASLQSGMAYEIVM